MTEQEWLECTDPTPMLGFVRNNASERKVRLLAVASCRRVWNLLEDKRSLQGVETAELFADGKVDESQLDDALGESAEASEAATYREHDNMFVSRCQLARAVDSAAQPPSGWGAAYRGWEALADISGALAILRPESAVQRCPYPDGDMVFEFGIVFTTPLSLNEQIHQAHFVRDIFGNPFRPVAIIPGWPTPTVNNLASVAYGPVKQ